MPTSGLADRVDAVLAPLVEANEFRGAVVISRRGKTLYQRGFGMANQAAQRRFTPNTPADGGSLAKTFTAAGVWMLAEEGLVDLDAPVTRYVSEFPHAQTTLRHLLTHSNGLPPDYEFFDPYFSAEQVRTTRGLLRVVAEHAPRPRFEPASRFEYSNLGFDVAALVIERVTGQTYEAFLRQRFFAPLGMADAFARPARLRDWQGVRTLGYRWREGSWKLFDVFDMEAFLGASNLYFSAADLGRWADAHAAGIAPIARLLDSGQNLPQIAGKPSAITELSWYCDGKQVRCYYTGSLNAFHSFVYWDRARGESVAFVSNSTAPPWTLINLQRSLVEALALQSVRPETRTSFAAFTRDERARVAGSYIADGIGIITVKKDADGLAVRVNCGLELGLYPASRDVFYAPGADYWIAFENNQKPASMYLRSMFVDTLLTRVPDQARASASACE